MSVYRSGGRGTWIVERSYRGIGPVRLATGTYDFDIAVAIEVMISEFVNEGRDDLVRQMLDRQVRPVALYQAYRRFGLNLQLSAERGVPLTDAIDAWLKRAELGAKTLEDYGYSLRAVARLRPTAVLTDLPALLARYVQRKRRKPSAINRTLSAARRFAQDVAGKGAQSDLYRAVEAIPWASEKPRNVGLGLAPFTARAVAEALERRLIGLGRMWWTLCCTGMGWTEYTVSGWEVKPDRILIHGTKTERFGDQRDRIIFRACNPVRASCSEWKFAKELRAVGADLGLTKLTIYVARRTFAHWLELAKILDSRCDAYMGHSPEGKGMRALYREHDVVPYLKEDVAAFRAVMPPEPRYLQAVNA